VSGGDAVSPAGAAHGGGVFAVDQAVHFFPRQAASQSDGGAGGAGVSDASGGGPAGGGSLRSVIAGEVFPDIFRASLRRGRIFLHDHFEYYLRDCRRAGVVWRGHFHP